MKHSRPVCDIYPRSDQAIATVISVILLLGLIIAITTTLHLSYIPAWKNDAEYSHMDDVYPIFRTSQMSYLRFFFMALKNQIF